MKHVEGNVYVDSLGIYRNEAVTSAGFDIWEENANQCTRPILALVMEL